MSLAAATTATVTQDAATNTDPDSQTLTYGRPDITGFT